MSAGPSVAPPRTADEVAEGLSRGGPALVALSGGVDSSLVAALAVEALGRRAVAVTLSGPAVAQAEVRRAREVAGVLGIRHEVLAVDPLARAEYRANPPNRCYFCRAIETHRLRAWALREGWDRFLDGVHRDDLGEDRPGLRAMREAGFEHPLLEANWGKREVREEARRRALPNWDAPSDACLASRVAHGEPLSAELLARIESAEAEVRRLGFRRVRLRVRDGKARLEVDRDEVVRLQDRTVLERLRSQLRPLGFAEFSVDPLGYRPRPGM